MKNGLFLVGIFLGGCSITGFILWLLPKMVLIMLGLMLIVLVCGALYYCGSHGDKEFMRGVHVKIR